MHECVCSLVCNLLIFHQFSEKEFDFGDLDSSSEDGESQCAVSMLEVNESSTNNNGPTAETDEFDFESHECRLDCCVY